MKMRRIIFIILLIIALSEGKRVIKICDCASFAAQMTNPVSGAYYELTADLYCQGVINKPLASFGSATLDGRGYSIIGLYINLQSSSSSFGLFTSLTDGAVIKNLYFIDCTVQGNINAIYDAGMLAGTANCNPQNGPGGATGAYENTGGCLISNVHIGTSKRSSSNTVQSYGQSVGGVIGSGEGLTVRNCTVRDTVVVALDSTLKNFPPNTRNARQVERRKIKAHASTIKHTRRSKPRTSPLSNKIGKTSKSFSGRNPLQASAPQTTPTSSAAGGLIGAVKNSLITGCHQRTKSFSPHPFFFSHFSFSFPIFFFLIFVLYYSIIKTKKKQIKIKQFKLIFTLKTKLASLGTQKL